jgi:hypothetical protein
MAKLMCSYRMLPPHAKLAIDFITQMKHSDYSRWKVNYILLTGEAKLIASGDWYINTPFQTLYWLEVIKSYGFLTPKIENELMPKQDTEKSRLDRKLHKSRLSQQLIKKDDQVKTAQGMGKIWCIDKDGTICVALDSGDNSILHEFDRNEVEKV